MERTFLNFVEKVEKRASKIRVFFPKTARGHGGMGARCNASNCETSGGRNGHFQDTLAVAEAFVLSTFSESAEE